MVGWQCLCFAILLLPDLDAASVKLIHTGTETIEKDGVKHERSRYRLVPEHENDEPGDKDANKNLPNNEHSTNLAADKESKTIAIKVLPNEEHHDKLTVDKHAKKIEIKFLPNDRYEHGLKTDESTSKVALRFLPNDYDAQDKLTYHYSTKTQPKSAASHKTTYHYSTKTQPKVTEWSSEQNMNGSALNLWNKDPSKDLYSHTRRNGDNQDQKLSHNKKIKKILFSKEFLELMIKQLNTQNHLTAEKKLQMRLLIETLLEKFYKSNSKASQETENGLANNELLQQHLYNLNTQKELENHENEHETLQQKLNRLNTEVGQNNPEYDQENLQQNRYSLNTRGEHKIHGDDHEQLQNNLLTLHTHENKNDHDIANHKEKHQDSVPKQNLHLLENGASQPKTLELGHIGRLETETPVHNDTYKDIIESNVQTEILPNRTSIHTETGHKLLEVTTEKPIQFNHSHLLRYLISSVGLNKTFVMPGEKGRYKLLHEGDEEAGINSALIHWLRSQKKHIPSVHKRIMIGADGRSEDQLKVLPLHHTVANHKKHTSNAQTEPDTHPHIPVSIYHHGVNEILPQVANSLDSITESIIHIDKEPGTITSTTEKIDVTSAELKQFVDGSHVTTTDNILSLTDHTLTTLSNAHGTTDNESNNVTSATENPEVLTTKDIDISELLNDPSMLELLSSYGLDMNDIVYEPEINIAIPYVADQSVTVVDPTITRENSAYNHELDITSTPEDHEASTTEIIDISNLENNPALLELLTSYGLDMHDIVDEPEMQKPNPSLAVQPEPSLNAHGFSIQNRTTTEAIDTDYEGVGVTSTTVNHEESTTEVINISKLTNDPSLLELLSSYGLDLDDIFHKPEMQNANFSPAFQHDEATEPNRDGIDRSSTNENPEVSTTEVIDISNLENDASLLELLTSYGLKIDDIVGTPEEHIAIPSLTAPPGMILDLTTIKATDAYNDSVDINKTTDHEMLTSKVIDLANLNNNSSLFDLPTLYGLEPHDNTEKYMAMPSLADDTIKELLETKGTKEKEPKKDRVHFTSTPDNNIESTTEDRDMSKLLKNPSSLDLLAFYGLKMPDNVDEPDVPTAILLPTAHGVVSTELYATDIPQHDLDDIINYYMHTAEHLPETDDYEIERNENGKPLVVLDEINKDEDDNDDLKQKLLALLEHETELANLLELDQDITTDDPLSEYEDLLTEPVDNHTSTLPGPHTDDDDDLRFRMDELQREGLPIENVSSNDLINLLETIQEPDQSKDLNQTWPQSLHAKEIPRSSRIIYREEIRHSGNDNNNDNSPNINYHNNLNLVKQSENALINAVAPDDFSHDADTYHNNDGTHESLQDTNNNANEHYLEIILGYLNSDILTHELNALMAYSGPKQDRDQVTKQFVVGYLNKLGINHHISQEQLQFLTHKVLKHLLDYNKQYKVHKIELIYEFNHPHDLSSNVNNLPKNVRGQFLSYPHNVRIQEHVPNFLPDDHLVPNSYHELQQDDVDVHDHNLHNVALHPKIANVSDQTHMLWYNQNPDLVAFSDLDANPHTHENSNQKHMVSVPGLVNSPSLHQLVNQNMHDIGPHQNQHAQNIPKGNSVTIEQRNLFPDSDQEGEAPKSKNESNEHNANYDYNDSDSHLDNSDHLNLVPGDVIHYQQSDQLAPNDNVDKNEPSLNSDLHLFDSEHSNYAPEQNHMHKNSNLAPNHNADATEKELNWENHDFDNNNIDSDHLNVLPLTDSLGPNHNVDRNEHYLNSHQHNPDYHVLNPEYLNLASGHQQQNDHYVPNKIADLKEHELHVLQNHFNNNHDTDPDDSVPHPDLNQYYPDNQYIDSEHLNLIPDHHSHQNQKDHLNPNYNVDNYEHALGLHHQNTEDHLAYPDHSNLASGEGYNHKNDHLAPNQSDDLKEHEIHVLQNHFNNNHDTDPDDSVPHPDLNQYYPDNQHIDSEHLNLVPNHHSHQQQKNHLAPNYNPNNNEHTLGLHHQNTDDHLADPDHANLAPGEDYNHNNDHLAPNQSDDLKGHELNVLQNHFNNKHDTDPDDFVPNLDPNHHFLENHNIDSDHLNLIPDHHSHQNQKDHLNPNYNVDNYEHALGLHHQNTEDHLADPDHSNLASGEGYNHKNDHLAPNQNADFNIVPNIDSDNYHPENYDVDSDHDNTYDHLSEPDHTNSALEQDHYHQIVHMTPNHNANLNEHRFNSDHDNSGQHFIHTDHINSAPGQYYNPQNKNLALNQNGGLNEHKIDVDHHNVNNHDDHLNVVPKHLGHHQQNGHWASNHNDDNNKRILDLYHQNLKDHLTNPDHSNLDLEHNSDHKQNVHLAPNNNPILYSQNSNFDNLNPYKNLVNSDLLNSVHGHLAQNHGSLPNNIDPNEYHSNTLWGAQPEQNFVSNPNAYSSSHQQIDPLKTEKTNLDYEPHFSILDHQQNEQLSPSPSHHQIELDGNLHHQVGADYFSLHYTLPYQQFGYIESSIYPQPDNFVQLTGLDLHNQLNPYPLYSLQQNEWYSPYQTLSPEQSNWAASGLAHSNIDLSSYQPDNPSYSDQNVYVDQRINLPMKNQHNGYEALRILDGTQLNEYLTDGIELPNQGVISGLATKVHSLVSYLLDHGVSESIVLEFVDDVKKQLAEEFLERQRECQNKAYAILVQSIRNLAQVYLEKHR